MGDSPTNNGNEWTRMIAWQAGGSSPGQLAECQKVALQHQQELIDDAQQHMSVWAKRRQEALETGIDALTRMTACKTPVSAASIYSEWLSGSITRMLADFDDAQAHALKMAEHFQQASKALFQQAQHQQEAAQTGIATEVAQPPMREAAD